MSDLNADEVYHASFSKARVHSMKMQLYQVLSIIHPEDR